MLQQVSKGRKGRAKTTASWPEDVREAHAALVECGLRALEPSGWRELGIGAIVASGAAFRALALDVAADWAAFELRGGCGEDVAPRLARARHALKRSRLGVFRVAAPHGAQPRLLDLRTRVHVTVAGCVRPHLILPTGATVIARLAGSPALLVSSTVVDETQLPEEYDCSGALLRHLLARAAMLDDADEVLEPRLLEVRPDTLAQLDDAMLALEPLLTGAQTRWRVDRGELVAQRHAVGWRVALRSAHTQLAAVERVPTTVAHPFDVELMRQIGVEHYVWEVEGDLDALIASCVQCSARSRTAA